MRAGRVGGAQHAMVDKYGIEHASVHLRTRLDPTFGAAGQSMQSHLHGGQDSLRGGAASVRLVLDMHGVARPSTTTEREEMLNKLPQSSGLN